MLKELTFYTQSRPKLIALAEEALIKRDFTTLFQVVWNIRKGDTAIEYLSQVDLSMSEASKRTYNEWKSDYELHKAMFGTIAPTK
jgi:hypothetical protein